LFFNGFMPLGHEPIEKPSTQPWVTSTKSDSEALSSDSAYPHSCVQNKHNGLPSTN
jgi:hypothetical protein